MKSKNLIKVLPVVLLLTGCNGGSNSKDIGKEIERSEFEKVALSLKNNVDDYSSIKETFKTEKVEASGGNAKSYLDLLLMMQQEKNEYKEGYTFSHDIAPSTLYTTLSFYQETKYSDFNAKYYSNNNVLTVKYVAEGSVSNSKLHQEMDFYFNSDGLEELFDFKITQTFEDNSTLYTYFKTTYTWSK